MDTMATLRQENEDLRYRIRDLEKQVFGTEWNPPTEWHLSPTQTEMMRSLVAKDVVAHEHLQNAMERSAATWAMAERHNLSVQMHRIRKRLKPFGWKIISVWGVGFTLQNRTAVRQGQVYADGVAG